jgi:hypothetical protein
MDGRLLRAQAAPFGQRVDLRRTADFQLLLGVLGLLARTRWRGRWWSAPNCSFM